MVKAGSKALGTAALSFVAKPFTANTLLKTVSDALLASGQEDQE